MPQNFLDLFGGSVVIATLVGLGAIMGYLTVNAMMLVWLERKVSAWIQGRMGPTEHGPAGLMQSVWDIVKLVSKQLIVPKSVDKVLYLLAPLVVFAPVVASFSLFPFSETTVIHGFDIGLVLVFTFGGFAMIGVFMAGWGSNNKYALLGAMRAVAQNIAYEIPLILSALSVVLMSSAMQPGIDAMNMGELSALQADRGYWFVLLQPVAALIFLISATAETNRAPFDIPEAESELVAGFHTEYGGMGFALFFFAEYTNMLIVSLVGAVLFFGGWHGPGPEWLGPVWLFGKAYLLILTMIWFRWTYPRLRFDQLMTFCWMVLIPLSILNLLITGLVVQLT